MMLDTTGSVVDDDCMEDELSNDQLAELEADLKQVKSDLESLLEATEGGTVPVKLKDNAGRLSRMAELHDQSILMANRNVVKNRLKQVVVALERMHNGTYGDCSACGEPINFSRLKAYPDAAMCLACKSETE